MYCLSIEQINRISPYKVEIASDGNSLLFHTRYGLVYEVGFVEDVYKRQRLLFVEIVEK